MTESVKEPESQEEPKTPEQLLEEKKAAFETDPNLFIHMDDVLVGIYKDPRTGKITNGHKCMGMDEAMHCKGVVDYMLISFMMDVRDHARMNSAKKIIPGTGGIKNFVRRGLK